MRQHNKYIACIACNWSWGHADLRQRSALIFGRDAVGPRDDSYQQAWDVSPFLLDGEAAICRSLVAMLLAVWYGD